MPNLPSLAKTSSAGVIGECARGCRGELVGVRHGQNLEGFHVGEFRGAGVGHRRMRESQGFRIQRGEVSHSGVVTNGSVKIKGAD